MNIFNLTDEQIEIYIDQFIATRKYEYSFRAIWDKVIISTAIIDRATSISDSNNPENKALVEEFVAFTKQQIRQEKIASLDD